MIISEKIYREVSAAEFYEILRTKKKAKNLNVKEQICISNDLHLNYNLDFSDCVFEREVLFENANNINKNIFFSFCEFKQRLVFTNCTYSTISFNNCIFGQYFYMKNLIADTYKIDRCSINISKELKIAEFTCKQFIFTNNDAKSNIFIKPINVNSVIIEGSESPYLIIYSNNENPNIIDKFLIFSHSNYKTDYSIRNVKTNFIHLNGEIKDSNLHLNAISLKSGLIDFFTNFGNLRFNDITPLTDNSILIIKNSILGKASLSRIDFTKFKRIILTNSNIIEINPVNITWCKKENLNINDILSIKEDSRQIKIVATRNDDIPTKLYFHKIEMHSYLKQLKTQKGYYIDKIILRLNYLSNDFGLNWFFALMWLLGISVIWYTLIKACIGETNFDSTLIADEIGKYLIFLNPVHQFEKLFEVENLKENLNGALLFDGISRITAAYFIFQFITAFRKYTKK